MIRYGADYLGQDNKLADTTDAAVDVAVTTLAAMYPALAPYLSVMSKQAKPVVRKQIEHQINNVKNWAARGIMNDAESCSDYYGYEDKVITSKKSKVLANRTLQRP